MKLAIIAGDDVREWGGGERYVIELSNKLKDFDIEIFSLNRDSGLRLTESQIKHLTRIIIDKYNVVKTPLFDDNDMLTMSGLKVLNKLRGFDVIYNMDSSVITNFLLDIIGKVYKKRVIFGAHNPYFLGEVNKGGPNEIGNLRNRILFQMPNLHVLNSFDFKALKKEGYQGRIYYIPNFISITRKNGITANKKEFVVLFVSRLLKNRKGLDLLEKIVEDVLKRNRKIKFHLVGSGDDGEIIVKGLVRKYPVNVRRYGFVSNRVLEREYGGASLFISTSRFESFGLSLVEARSLGLPAVAFDVKGYHDILGKARYGKLITPLSTKAFSNEIIRYYSMWEKGKIDPDLKRKISKDTEKAYGEEVIIPKLSAMLHGE